MSNLQKDDSIPLLKRLKDELLREAFLASRRDGGKPTE